MPPFEENSLRNEVPSRKSKDGFADKLEEKIVRMKVQAVLLIMVFVIPGNLVTLIIYTTSEGKLCLSSSLCWLQLSTALQVANNGTLPLKNHTFNGTKIEDYDAYAMFSNEDDNYDYFGWYNEYESQPEDDNETMLVSWKQHFKSKKTIGNVFCKNDCGNASTCMTHAGYFCHEKFNIIQNLDSVRFWIEGVGLATVATIGLFGNLLTVVVIHKIDNRIGGSLFNQQQGRSPLDTILVALITLDSFLLFFSLFDSSYLASFHMPEPYW